MIRQVAFRNFKALRNVEIALEQFTVLVGPNSSGKSSILEGLHYLTQLGGKRPEEVFHHERDPLFLYSREATGDLEVSCEGSHGGIRVKITPPEEFPEDLLRPASPSSPSDRWSFSVEGKEPTPGEHWRPIGEVSRVGRFVRSVVRLRLEASRLAEPSYSEYPNPRVGYEGEFLPTVLAQMALNQPDDFQQLQARLRQIVPAVNRIRFTRAPVHRTEVETVTISEESVTRRVRREYMGDALVLDMKGAPSLPAHLASEGTLLVLGLLAVLFSPARPRLILVDDIDQALHPKAQLELASLIRTFLEQTPNVQLIATTHSPYVLDRLKPEEVRIVSLDDNGSSVCGRLEDHPEFDRWKDEMTPGEFWMMFGEKFLTQQQFGGNSDAGETRRRL